MLFIFFTFHKLLLLFSAKFLSFIFQLNFIIIDVLLLVTTVFTNKNYFFYKLIVNLFVCVCGYIYIYFFLSSGCFLMMELFYSKSVWTDSIPVQWYRKWSHWGFWHFYGLVYNSLLTDAY